MARDSVTKDDAEALDQALRSLFRNLETRALPDSLRPDSAANLLDQLLVAPHKTRLAKA